MLGTTPGRNRFRIAIVSARVSRNRDLDLPRLEEALRAAGADFDVADWDDDAVDWSAFDLALLRSPWDYTMRYTEFIAWAERVAALTTLANSLPVVRWNTDKRYLLDLAEAQVPVIPSQILAPGSDVYASIEAFLAAHDHAELVVKPAIGAGARDAQRHDRTDRAGITSHARRLLAQNRSVLIQPYLSAVDEHGETALIFFDGRFSHAIRKGPLLRRGSGSSQELFAEESISPRIAQPDELRVAEQAILAIPFGVPLYARVDLIRGDAGAPQVLEIELTEPSLFFSYAPGSAARFVDAVMSVRSRNRL